MKQNLPNPPPARHVQPEISPRRRRLRSINIGCAVTLPFLLILQLFTLWLSVKLAIPVLVIVLLIIPALFHLHEKTGKLRLPLAVFRVLGIAMTAAAIAIPVLCIRGTRIPQLYRIRRFIYEDGLHDAFHSKNSILPETLPAVHRDYNFSILPTVQDKSFLFLHTDTETLAQYEAQFAADPDVTCLTEDTAPAQTDETEQPERPQALPAEVWQKLRDTAGFGEDLSHAKIYHKFVLLEQRANGKLGISGNALINYETGLLAFWE